MSSVSVPTIVQSDNLDVAELSGSKIFFSALIVSCLEWYRRGKNGGSYALVKQSTRP